MQHVKSNNSKDMMAGAGGQCREGSPREGRVRVKLLGISIFKWRSLIELMYEVVKMEKEAGGNWGTKMEWRLE